MYIHLDTLLWYVTPPAVLIMEISINNEFRRIFVVNSVIFIVLYNYVINALNCFSVNLKQYVNGEYVEQFFV